VIIKGVSIGETKLKWSVSNGICPVSEDEVLVKREKEPEPAFAGKDVISEENNVRLEAVLPEGAIGKWSVESGNAVVENEQDPFSKAINLSVGDNVFKWTMQKGSCTSTTDEIVIYVKPFQVPNAFSPDHDGVNDKFEVTSLHYFGKVGLSVFNRWGTLIYKNDDYQNDWSGLNLKNENIPDDTYYYVLKGEGFKDQTGYVVIKTKLN